VDAYIKQNGKLPEDLSATSSDLTDPWGREYILRSERRLGPFGYQIVSRGLLADDSGDDYVYQSNDRRIDRGQSGNSGTVLDVE
jgi:hypothetical protein